MSNNYDDYGYEGNNNGGLFKKVLIVAMVVIAILIVIFLLRSCGSGTGNDNKDFDYESALLNAGKNYYGRDNGDEVPNVVGECSQVTLKTLIEKGLIDKDKFSGCNDTETYLRVCMLENGNKQYTPWVSCPTRKSEVLYGPNKEGTLKDIVTNETYVSFKFLPEILKTGEDNLGEEVTLWKNEITYENYKTISSTNYYRFRDKLYRWNVTTKKYYTTQGDVTDASKVKEYYVVSPNSNYKLYDNRTTEAYKWYTISGEKEYALGSNGEKRLNHVAIGDYTHNEGGVEQPVYRTGTLNGKTPRLYYMCATENNPDARYVKYQTKKCGESTDQKYIYQIGTIYSCANDSSDSVVGLKVDSATSKCYDWSNWSATTTCDPARDNCQKSSIMLYYWYRYKNGGVKSYYPSKSSSASGEKVYYTEAPVDGAIRDTDTKATAYKWYSASTKTTAEYTALAPSGYASASKSSEFKWGSWSEWSTTNPKTNDGRDRSIETKTKIKLRPILGSEDGNWEPLAGNTTYLTEEEMINLFKNNKYDINTLDDISNEGSVRYQVKMYIRNKKESK